MCILEGKRIDEDTVEINEVLFDVRMTRLVIINRGGCFNDYYLRDYGNDRELVIGITCEDSFKIISQIRELIPMVEVVKL